MVNILSREEKWKRALPLMIWLISTLMGGWAFTRSPLDPDGDELAYSELAGNLAAHKGYLTLGEPDTHISPLFPSAHALLILLGGDVGICGLLLPFLFTTLLAPLVFLLIKGLWGLPQAIGAALVVAIHPALLAQAKQIQPEALAACLLLWFLLLWSRGRPALAAFALGAAALARPEFALLFPVWIIIETARNPRPITRFIPPLLIFVSLLTPFGLYLHAVEGRFCLTGKDQWVYQVGFGQWKTRNQPAMMQTARELRADFPGILSHAMAHPRDTLYGYAYRWSLMARYALSLLRPIVLPFLAFGLFLAWKGARKALGYGLFPLLLCPLIPFGMIFPRHLVPYLPLVLAFAGVGAEAVAEGVWVLGRRIIRQHG